MTGRIKLSVLLLGITAFIVAAIVAGQIDRANAVPPGPPQSVPVEVVNTEVNPVPVVIENPGDVMPASIEPVTHGIEIFPGVTCPMTPETVLVVPAGKLLVIEDASVRITDSSNPAAVIAMPGLHAFFVTRITGQNAKVTIIGGNQVPISGGRPMTAYNGGNQAVTFEVEGCTGTVDAELSFWGQLLDVDN